MHIPGALSLCADPSRHRPTQWSGGRGAVEKTWLTICIKSFQGIESYIDTYSHYCDWHMGIVGYSANNLGSHQGNHLSGDVN